MVRGLLISEGFAASLRRGVQMDQRHPLSVLRPQPRQGVLLGGAELKFGLLNGAVTGGAGNKVSVAVWKLNDARDDWEDANEDLDDVYAPPLLHPNEQLDGQTWVMVGEIDGLRYIIGAQCSGVS